MPQQKLLLLLIDGIGDVAVGKLDEKTPLQVAKTPWLDQLAGIWIMCYAQEISNSGDCLLLPLASGVNGLMDSVEPGLACGSDTAHMSILGYNPRQ